ncbi:hypothetical protein UY3_00511 [Chelonia mydas]|uniref:Myb/SANT-like DNA-binding domain-containing protein n=1 Tax=Chelonia mydas TaxID=8469 RepID=M7C227_CHEMY|nr:hypothetical protein UY3_00511 [Chelonia mydas]
MLTLFARSCGTTKPVNKSAAVPYRKIWGSSREMSWFLDKPLPPHSYIRPLRKRGKSYSFTAPLQIGYDAYFATAQTQHGKLQVTMQSSSAEVTVQSSSAEVTMMESQNRKRAPAWTERKVWDLIAVWGEESVLSELRSSFQNAKTFVKISQGMKDRGHNRDLKQCRVKLKDLRQAYQRGEWLLRVRAQNMPLL